MPDILYPAKRDWVFILLGSLVVTALGVWIYSGGESPLLRCMGGIIALGAFVGLPVAVLHLLPNSSYLQISGDGLTVRSFWRTTHYRWVDISEFGVTAFQIEYSGIRQKHKRVGFNFSRYSPSLKRATSPERLRGRIGGYEAALPDTYGRDATELAGYLNQQRNRYLGQLPKTEIPLKEQA